MDSVFVARGEELKSAGELIEAAGIGTESVLCPEGGPGIAKTALTRAKVAKGAGTRLAGACELFRRWPGPAVFVAVAEHPLAPGHLSEWAAGGEALKSAGSPGNTEGGS